MSDSVLNFYDQLSEDYHLIFEDWDVSVKRQGKILDQIIGNHLNQPRHNIKVFDCSCGIGTQAIGLALLDYKVHATDLSPNAVSRAEREAQRLGANLSFGVADFRSINKQVEERYNVVISCDNSLPHLLDLEDLKLAMKNIWDKLECGGLFLASIRDYDQLLLEKPHATTPVIFDDHYGKRIVFQVWDWEHCGNVYTLNHFIVKEDGDNWRTDCRSTRYRALLRSELNSILDEIGFSDINWSLPKETGYYQPIVTAYKR